MTLSCIGKPVHADQACVSAAIQEAELVVLMQQPLCSVTQVAESSQSPGRCRYLYTIEARLAERLLSERDGLRGYG